jgi:hypothetical protein
VNLEHLDVLLGEMDVQTHPITRRAAHVRVETKRAPPVLESILAIEFVENLCRAWQGGHGRIEKGERMSTAETWPIFTAKLKSREEIAERTMAFHFEKPVGWAFKAGQFIDMTLLNPSQTDPEGNKRGFSIASAPQEETLMSDSSVSVRVPEQRSLRPWTSLRGVRSRRNVST